MYVSLCVCVSFCVCVCACVMLRPGAVSALCSLPLGQPCSFSCNSFSLGAIADVPLILPFALLYVSARSYLHIHCTDTVMWAFLLARDSLDELT